MNLVYPRWPCSHEHANWTWLHRTKRVSAVVKSGIILRRQCPVSMHYWIRHRWVNRLLKWGWGATGKWCTKWTPVLRVIRDTRCTFWWKVRVPTLHCQERVPLLVARPGGNQLPTSSRIGLVTCGMIHSEGNYFKCWTDFLASLSIKSTKLQLTNSLLPHLHFSK